jgi:CheY-like chemotaxis protein
MRSLIATALRADGFDVLEACDGRELHDMVRAMCPPGARMDLPDVIVSDVRMPGPSGLDGLSLLRQSTWAIPVIVITGFGDSAVHDEARRLGAAVVLDKPFDLDVLRTAVLALAPI